MTDAEQTTPEEAPPGAGGAAWLPWLAWGWVALLFLAALAELTGWEDLRLTVYDHTSASSCDLFQCYF